MLAQLSRERRTGKGGEPKQGSHGHTGESTTGLHRASVKSTDTAGGHFLMKKWKGRGQLFQNYTGLRKRHYRASSRADL
ncbi:unnamed protein product [Boreogadus saida]